MDLRRPGELTCFWVFLLVLLFGPATARCEPAKPIRIGLSTNTGFAPLTVTVRIVVPRSDANREVCLHLYRLGEDQQSCWTLNGARDGVEFYRTVRRLMPGPYVVIATLRRSDGFISSKPMNLVVVGE